MTQVVFFWVVGYLQGSDKITTKTAGLAEQRHHQIYPDEVIIIINSILDELAVFQHTHKSILPPTPKCLTIQGPHIKLPTPHLVMATLFLRRPFQTITPFTLCVGASTILLASQTASLRPRLALAYCDSPSTTTRPTASVSETFQTYTRDAKVPIFANGRPNPAAYRQISAGSILGLVGGVAVSYFSKTLALLVGMMVFGVQVSLLCAFVCKDSECVRVCIYEWTIWLTNGDLRCRPRAVSGESRDQCCADYQATAICQGDRSAVCD